MKFSRKHRMQFGVTALLFASGALLLSEIGLLAPISANPSKALVDSVPPEDSVEDFMQVKLATISDAMSSAATDDFVAIEKAGLDLIQLSKQVAWQQRSNATYLQDTTDFVSASQFMVRMARAKDSQGVAQAYAAVAVSCLHCHRHVREPKVAVAPRPLGHEEALATLYY